MFGSSLSGIGILLVGLGFVGLELKRLLLVLILYIWNRLPFYGDRIRTLWHRISIQYMNVTLCLLQLLV